MYAQSAAGSFLRQEKERCDAVMHDSEFPLDERKPGNLLAGLLGNADSLMRKSDGEPDELHNQNFLPPRPRSVKLQPWEVKIIFFTPASRASKLPSPPILELFVWNTAGLS